MTSRFGSSWLGAPTPGGDPAREGESTRGPRVNPPRDPDQRGARPEIPRPTPLRGHPGDESHHTGTGADRPGPAGLGRYVPRRRRDPRQAGRGPCRTMSTIASGWHLPPRPGQCLGRDAARPGRVHLPAGPGQSRGPGHQGTSAKVLDVESRDPERPERPQPRRAPRSRWSNRSPSRGACYQTALPHVARYNMAIAQLNLAELLMKARHGPMPGGNSPSPSPTSRSSRPRRRSLDFRSHLGSSLALQGKWFSRAGRLVEARAARIEQCRRASRQAVQLSMNGPPFRALLSKHLVELAGVDLELGDYDDAGRIGLQISNTVPLSARAKACLDSATGSGSPARSRRR